MAINTYISSPVSQTITDGVTNKAPSENAVFDALAGKQNALGFTPEDVANKQTDLTASATKYPTVNAVNTGLALKDSHIESAKKNHKFVEETVARVANNTWAYTGTVRNVPGTYATITAARAAASSGDIIQLADGVYNTASEAGGYLIVNDNKRILIRGNAADPTAVVIRQSSAASFCLRFRYSNETKFQDLTVESNQNNPTVTASMDTAASPVTFAFENCIINHTGSTTINTISLIGTPVNNCRFEFKECSLYQNTNATSGVMTSVDISDANSVTYYIPIIVTNCNIYGRVYFTGSSDLNFYDNTFKHVQSTIIFSIGTNTSAPTYLSSHVDLRCNSFEYTSTFTDHAVLLGRGTKDVYFVNNKVIMNSGTNSLSLGVVIKSQPSALGGCIVDGNYIEAPRPLYMKGSLNCYARNNTSISVWGDDTYGFGFELNNPNNPDGAISTIGNVISGNNFIGVVGALGFSTDTAVLAITSAKQCVFRDNIYSVPTGENYINTPATTWSNRYTTWKQDVNSLYFEI